MEIRCVVGLGNPGERYVWTRHNLGFRIVDRVAVSWGFEWTSEAEAREAIGDREGRRIVLLKPMTYMNNSGGAVRSCLERHGLVPEELLVVVDDAALPFARFRIRTKGSSGGHRGLSSIECAIESQVYPRLRAGVDPPAEGEDLADYLLRPIPEAERPEVLQVVERGAVIVEEIVMDGVERAMNRHNPAPSSDGNDSVGPESEN